MTYDISSYTFDWNNQTYVIGEIQQKLGHYELSYITDEVSHTITFTIISNLDSSIVSEVNEVVNTHVKPIIAYPDRFSWDTQDLYP